MVGEMGALDFEPPPLLWQMQNSSDITSKNITPKTVKGRTL